MTKEIQESVCRYLSSKGCEHICENFGHMVFEMDVASLSKSDMLTEYEVKVSRSDFLADKKKKANNDVSKFEMYVNCFGYELKCPNYFYYVCPDGLISVSEIPEFSGLIYFVNGGISVVKSAKRIHSKKCDRLKVLSKMLRITTQRKYLGRTMLTYKNNLIKQKNLGRINQDSLFESLNS